MYFYIVADARVRTEMTLTREPCNIRTNDSFTPSAGHDDNGGYITPVSREFILTLSRAGVCMITSTRKDQIIWSAHL